MQSKFWRKTIVNNRLYLSEYAGALKTPTRRSGSANPSRSSTARSFYPSNSVAKFDLEKTIANDTQALLQHCKKEKETLKIEKELLLNKYEGKLKDLSAPLSEAYSALWTD